MLTRDEVERYRERLQSLATAHGVEREELERLSRRPIGGTQDDAVELEAEEELSLSLLGHEEQLVRDIYDALARTDAGAFGRCEGCGKPIAKRRLAAIPYARYCIRCARDRERLAAADLPGTAGRR